MIEVAWDWAFDSATAIGLIAPPVVAAAVAVALLAAAVAAAPALVSN